LSIGEILWDIFPDGDHLGGAPFNFAAACVRLGHRTIFLSTVGDDELGRRTLNEMAHAGVSAEFLQRTTEAGTGSVRVAFDTNHQPQYTIIRPAAYDFLFPDKLALAEIVSRKPEFLYFGTLSQVYENNRVALMMLIEALPDALRFYDVNLRQDCFSLELLQLLMPLARVVKLNQEEATVVQSLFGTKERDLKGFCRTYSEQFGWRTVWVTRGADGCSVLQDGKFMEAPGFPVDSPNPVGAGDAFSAAVCHGISRGWGTEKIAGFANRVGALVASRPGAVSEWSIGDSDALGQ